MGLDQVAYTKDENGEREKNAKGEVIDLADWRKHNRLHGWMEKLWREKGECDGEFNCVEMELTEDDIENLESAIADKSMPETEGLCFGGDSYGDSFDYYADGDREADLKFVEAAHEAIAKGLRVFYNSWW